MNPARLVHPGFWFGKNTLDEAYKLAELGAGGFCIYGGTPKEIEKFSNEIRKRTPYSSILISADYEDGLGRWVKGTELLPSNMAVAAAGEEDVAVKKGLITARQARSLGVDWVFAPVVDLACTPDNPIVNTRSFGCNPDLVAKMAMAFMAGMSQGGVLNSLKHFPGHGATITDSHLKLPVIEKSLDEIFEYDLLPYRKLLKFADSIMVGHLLIPALDDKEPSSLSEKTVRGLLRQKLNFKGCVLTDAMLMDAIGDQKEAAIKALKAGVDILLAPKNPLEIIETISKLPAEDYRWKDFFINAIATQEMLIAKNTKAEVRTPEHALFKSTYAVEVAPKCITSLGAGAAYQKGTAAQYLAFDCESFEETPFYKKLVKDGVLLTPYEDQETENLLLVSYAGYASFKGFVNFTEKQKETALNAAGKAKNITMVSFGTPFVHKDFLKTANRHLLCYCPNDDFQTVCADALMGKIKVTGKLPIKFT